MKTLLIILASVGVAFASAYLIVTNQMDTRNKQEMTAAQAQWQEEKSQLESALAVARRQSGPQSVSSISSAVSPQPSLLSPKQIIDALAAIKPTSGLERTHQIRQIVYYFESLTEWEQEALPDIKEFLARNEDVDYTVVEETADENTFTDQNNRGGGRGNRQRNGNENIWQFRRGGELRTDFVVPPSMRLGLVDVLRAIGGSEAEQILVSMLETTGRGIEVAYLARVLEQMSPGKYHELAVTAAKDLLLHPLAVDGSSRLDENSKGYLYGVLAMYNDTSFAATAQTMLISSDGRLDRSVLNYLNGTLKEQAVPSLYAAYQNPAISNMFDKASIARGILEYAGNNPTANQLLTDIVNNNELDARMRSFAIMQLAGGGFGPFGTESPTDSLVIARRKQLAQTLLTGTTDETITRALNNTIVNLDHLAKGEPIENFGFRGGRGGRGGFGGGNRGD